MLPLSLYLNMSRFLCRRFPPSLVSHKVSACSRRSYASASPISQFDWEDPLASKTLLTDEELAISDTAERYCQEHLLPRVLGPLLYLPVDREGCDSSLLTTSALRRGV